MHKLGVLPKPRTSEARITGNGYGLLLTPFEFSADLMWKNYLLSCFSFTRKDEWATDVLRSRTLTNNIKSAYSKFAVPVDEPGA